MINVNIDIFFCDRISHISFLIIIVNIDIFFCDRISGEMTMKT